MSRRDVRSPTAPYLSPIKSQTDLNKTILTQLFSKEFLGCLKDELNTKLKQTKSYESLYKRLVIQAKTYKREMQKMRVKILELTSKNNQLNNKLAEYELQNSRLRRSSISSKQNQQSLQTQPTILILPPKYQNKLIIARTFDIHINDQLAHLSREEQIQVLRQKIQKLQIYKSIKDQRLNEMLQKQVRFDSQIKYLKVKNDELEEEVKSLRQTIIVQTQDQKPLKATFEGQKFPDIAISYHHFSQIKKKNPFDMNLMVSYTNNVNIPQSQELSKLYQLKHQHISQFNQIDYLIGEELPYVNTSTQLNVLCASNASSLKVDNNNVTNLNDSVVFINL